jgi:hypothetical protein
MKETMRDHSGSSGRFSQSLRAADHFLTDYVDVSEHSPTTKPTSDYVEQIHTNERVPGHTNYYEKDGLRTYGDGEDHDHEPPLTFKRLMSLVAMAFCKHKRSYEAADFLTSQ